MNHIDAGHHLKELAGHMWRCAVAGRRKVDLAGIDPGIGDKLEDGLRRNGRVYQHDVGDADDPGDGRDVSYKIETEIFVQCRIDRSRWRDEEKRIAVWYRTHDEFSANISASARFVFEYHRLAEMLRQPLADQACENIDRAAGGCADNNADGPRRISLRPRDP